MTRPQAPSWPIRRWSAGHWQELQDAVVAEEPLQLILDGEPLSIVMRTPGSDVELALGLLWAERVIRALDDVSDIHISAESGEADQQGAMRVVADLVESNVVAVSLTRPAGRRPERSFLASSACGVCGATTVESLTLDFAPVAGAELRVASRVVAALPERLREQQRIFATTGALHAAGLFDRQGDLVHLREDVGRHNAVDKVVGRALLDGTLPLSESVLSVSGRAGYEIVQKAIAAGIPILVAVGAPSTLAISTAQRFGVTLVGFARGDRFNAYTCPERVN